MIVRLSLWRCRGRRLPPAGCDVRSPLNEGERKQIHGVDVRHFDDSPCPVHAAEGAAEVPSFAEQLRRCDWNEDRTVGTPRPSLKALEPKSSRFNLGDGAVIEIQNVVAQVVRAKGEVSGGVVQNPGCPLGLGQIPGGRRAEICPLLSFVLGDVPLRGRATSRASS